MWSKSIRDALRHELERCGEGVVDALNIFTPLFPYLLIALFVKNGKYNDL